MDVELFLNEVLLLLLAQVFGFGVGWVIFLAFFLAAGVHLLGRLGLTKHGIFGDRVHATVLAVCASSGASRVVGVKSGIAEIRSPLFALLLELAFALLHPLFLCALCLFVVEFTVAG